MNGTIPQALRNADITRFAIRAAQLEKIEPVISYWCYYWVVNKILSKQLHLADDETRAYTADLMDRLEKYRLEFKDHETVTDDIVAQAFVEQFGAQAFQRADNAMTAKRATQQTADTFRAAATFLDLLGIWGSLSQEVSSRSKYAKHHALRIQKALKAGEDPNTYNLPQVSEETQQSNELSHLQNEQDAAISPLMDTNGSVTNTQPGSDQGEFPLRRTSEPTHEDASRKLPDSNYMRPFVEEDASQMLPSVSEHTRYEMPITSPQQEMSASGGLAPSSSSNVMPNTQGHYQMPAAASEQPKQASQLTSGEPIPEGRYKTDDIAISDAQKHARWAVSALNFEDVDTAVKELKIALNALGAV